MSGKQSRALLNEDNKTVTGRDETELSNNGEKEKAIRESMNT